MFYVLQIIDNMPGQLRGPADWHECINFASKLIEEHEPLTEEIQDYLETDGYYASRKIGGEVYILQSEEINNSGIKS